MNEILATVQLIGVFLLVGGVLFLRLIWNTVSIDTQESLNLLVIRRSTWLIISGATIFVSISFTELLLSGNPAGLLDVSATALPAVFVALFLAGEARKSTTLASLAAVVGLIVIGSLSAASHAAKEPGLLPIVSNFVHWIAALAWGGSLIYLSLLPWPAIYRDYAQSNADIRPFLHRYSSIAITALGLFALSGGLLAFVHVHNADAMATTHYGRFITFKAFVVVVLFFTVSFSRLKLAQSVGSENRKLLSRLRAVVTVESILLAALLIATGNIEVRDPPGVPPFNNPQSWQMAAGEVPLSLNLQPVGGSSTQARIEISAIAADDRFDEGTRAFFDFYTSNRDASDHEIEAVWIGPSGFLGETVVAVPGEWIFELRLDYADGTSLTGESVLELPALPLEQDLKPFLSLAAIAYSLPGLITFIVGVLLLLSAGWLLRQSWLGKAPAWLMTVSMASMIFGGYLALSVAFVKTYPTTFWSNPEPYSVDVIQRGDAIYRSQCADCHGISGKGDGAWAIAERGAIPDLTAPHMDVHTDGEIFWWLTKGIPSLDMPPMAEELSEADRWTVINYIRSLRHGMPAE